MFFVDLTTPKIVNLGFNFCGFSCEETRKAISKVNFKQIAAFT
jgi:hypothetical protein